MEKLKTNEKWNIAISLFAESVLKPDNQLRQAAYEEDCYSELMNVRDAILEHLGTIRK
jgi:hypothetical protein